MTTSTDGFSQDGLLEKSPQVMHGSDSGPRCLTLYRRNSNADAVAKRTVNLRNASELRLDTFSFERDRVPDTGAVSRH